MNASWPTNMRLKPIVSWPVEQTKNRQRSNFSAPWATTLDQLDRELYQLRARNVVLQVAMAERDFRIDGYPRAQAKAQHPGVILTFDSRHGPLSYPCDTFTDWQDNLRAITLAMEALRKVDRYGVTKRGEQYAGWKQLPAGNGFGFSTADEAEKWMRDKAGVANADYSPRNLHRVLARRFHPDVGGDRYDWDRLDAAKRLLEEAGRLR